MIQIFKSNFIFPKNILHNLHYLWFNTQANDYKCIPAATCLEYTDVMVFKAHIPVFVDYVLWWQLNLINILFCFDQYTDGYTASKMLCFLIAV